MEREIYELVHASELSWWYKGRRFVILRALSRFAPAEFITNTRTLDIGAGGGGMYPFFRAMGRVSALEPDAESRKLLAEKGYEDIMANDEELLKRPGIFSLVGAFDVIEHISDEKKFLEHVRASLAPNGILALTVPAFQFLWSTHDVRAHHFRRYTKKKIVFLLREAGFDVQYASYWNCALFFPAAVIRLLGFAGWRSLSLSSPLDKTILAVIKAESFLLPRISLPFGTGIVVVARKKF